MENAISNDTRHVTSDLLIVVEPVEISHPERLELDLHTLRDNDRHPQGCRDRKRSALRTSSDSLHQARV
jgi:hypothetical protein